MHLFFLDICTCCLIVNCKSSLQIYSDTLNTHLQLGIFYSSITPSLSPGSVMGPPSKCQYSSTFHCSVPEHTNVISNTNYVTSVLILECCDDIPRGTVRYTCGQLGGPVKNYYYMNSVKAYILSLNPVFWTIQSTKLEVSLRSWTARGQKGCPFPFPQQCNRGGTNFVLHPDSSSGRIRS